jgi:mono/diheme cytochrome c family protein
MSVPPLILGAPLGALLLAVLATPFAVGTQSEPDVAPGDEAFRSILKERAKELDPRAVGIGKWVPDLAFEDYLGQPGRLSDYADRRALVVVVRQIGCPVSDRYGARLARLEREYADRGVSFLFVNMDKYLEDEEVREGELEPYGMTGRYVHDPDEAFGRLFGAETTTPVYVLDASRTLRYRGAVDDQYGRGVILPEARREYLREALDAILAGGRVDVPATSAPGCLLDIERDVEVRPPEQATYHREVARILQANCAECHHDGGAAPFSLETYADAYDRRRMLRLVVEGGVMPPWYAHPDTGPWKNDRRLSDEDKEALLAWVDHGAVEGDSAEAPTPVVWNDGWVIGEPDVIFRLKEVKSLPAEGEVQWDPLDADRVVEEDLWIKALQIRPTDPTVVHHVLMFFQPPKTYGVSEGDQLMGALAPWSRKPAPGPRFLAGMVPGSGARVMPDGVARFVPKGSRLVFDMHYTPSGRATTDRTMLGLVLADEPPEFISQLRAIQTFKINIEPGEKVTLNARGKLHHDVLVRSLNPHMHYRGTSFLAEVIYPDGREETLIDLPVWDPDWQLSYYFADERLLPAGSRILLTGTFDNSADNPNNPDSEQTVRFGQQNWDEMLYLAMDCVAPREMVEAAMKTPSRTGHGGLLERSNLRAGPR